MKNKTNEKDIQVLHELKAELEMAKFRDETYERLVSSFGMSHEQANFVICLTQHSHSTLGAALYEINDYLDLIGV